MALNPTGAAGARFLVTGSEGFVGRHVRAAIERRGGSVLGVDRPGTAAELPVDLGAEDFAAGALWDRVGGPVQAVIHLAATISRASSVSARARANLRAIAGAPVLLAEEGARRGWLARAVLCSSFKVFGRSDEKIHPVLTGKRPDPFSYGSAKALAERSLEVLARSARFALVTLYPTCIYGPGQHSANAIPVFLEAALRGRDPSVHGTGTSLRDDVFVGDLAELLVEAGLRSVTGAFIAGGEGARSIHEVAAACCTAIAETGGPTRAPRLALETPAKWWLDQRFDLEPTERAFGYRPTPLAEGLRAQARWMRAGMPADTAAFASGTERSEA